MLARGQTAQLCAVVRNRTSDSGKDARTLAENLLAMSQEEFSTAFRKSPVKRAKLAGLKRNAAIVLRR